MRFLIVNNNLPKEDRLHRCYASTTQKAFHRIVAAMTGNLSAEGEVARAMELNAKLQELTVGMSHTVVTEQQGGGKPLSLTFTRIEEGQTLFIAPGNLSCRIYLIPYPMRAGQSPNDILPDLRSDWVEVGLMNSRLEVVHLTQPLQHLRGDIQGSMGGTCFYLTNDLKHRD